MRDCHEVRAINMNRAPSLDLSNCTGCEACLELCPAVFKQNQAGYFEVAPLSSYPEECVEEAINCCPADCISWGESELDPGVNA
jgi:ferredoxin